MDGVGNSGVLSRVPPVVEDRQCKDKHSNIKRKNIILKPSRCIFPRIFSRLRTFFHTLFFGQALKLRKCRTIKETDQTKAEKITRFTTVLNEYVSTGIKINKLPNLTPKINEILHNMRAFVQGNNLSLDEISTLRTALANFSRNEEVIRLYPGHSSSINASDHNQYCFRIALRIEAIEILLDAKEKNYVRLERNGPPETLGRGQYNTVLLAYTKKNKKRAIVLKPCDRSKQEQDSKRFNDDSQLMKQLVGYRSGSHRRNKATSRLQDMLCDIGLRNGITVPHVIASVFGAEVNGIPCIGMEKVDGLTLAQAVREGKIPSENNDFIRSATWVQLQDVLTGQIDRHGNNIILAKGTIPVAIDHDLSFSTSQARTSAGTIPKTLFAVDDASLRNHCIPPVIDEDMYKVIKDINLDELEKMYRECGLTSSEIDPAMARAQALKKKVEKLKQHGLVIKPDEWERSEQVKRLCTPKNFYALSRGN
ncbi:MAG: hypothetical protein LBC11_03105 [Puniceicoccales bacterium]|jgi:hypothetical protein|nr:hypothetical protein [Puniceicoccales bacterium]